MIKATGWRRWFALFAIALGLVALAWALFAALNGERWLAPLLTAPGPLFAGWHLLTTPPYDAH